MEDKKAVLLFELGHLQVFCYQTIEEWSKGIQPQEIFWQKKDETQIHGPFTSLYQAVSNYSACIAFNKQEILKNLIQVDFRAKRRIK